MHVLGMLGYMAECRLCVGNYLITRSTYNHSEVGAIFVTCTLNRVMPHDQFSLYIRSFYLISVCITAYSRPVDRNKIKYLLKKAFQINKQLSNS